MRKKPLEITCYVAGAGAFGVFFRWLQDMIAFNELGLVDRSVFNYLVPLFVLAQKTQIDRLARVIATFILLSSRRKPMFPSSLERTKLMIITSLSCP